jgi:hypothetical protein
MTKWAAADGRLSAHFRAVEGNESRRMSKDAPPSERLIS